MTKEEIILNEWNGFINKTPKNTSWYLEFEKFIETEPYKTAFETWYITIKRK